MVLPRKFHCSVPAFSRERERERKKRPGDRPVGGHLPTALGHSSSTLSTRGGRRIWRLILFFNLLSYSVVGEKKIFFKNLRTRPDVLRKSNNPDIVGFVFFLHRKQQTPSDDEHRKQSRGTEQTIREDGQLPPGRRLSPGTIQLLPVAGGPLQNTCCFFRLTSSLGFRYLAMQ
ncbi:hypothetical protein CDAR_94951 [Caerostris darwini]|uniref:Uncharacterized protein n=1 Tax=Caerostris darwini TaxID=1538125 RepID=A0AAV4PHS1_9ARAC|nr:hypothetical protein CDAR_94951 [Caerostris darwini]